VVLYLRKNQEVDFDLPKNWETKTINWPRFWTQIGLSLEMLLRPVDALFVPAHTVPIIHPKNTIVTIHGLEYEFCGGAYSFLERIYMRCSIKNSCQWARKIIAVSENTKKDLMKLYNVSEEKIDVIYEGYDCPAVQNHNPTNKYGKYLSFIGRIEERKNIVNIINAFEILKEQYKIPHKLVLAGKPGFGYEKIKDRIANANCQKNIVELGYISKEERSELLKNADVFVFPTLYEGFGIPVLEAQSLGTPVVASNNSSIPEVTSGSVLLVDPNNAEEIADAIYKIISDENIKQALIGKGLENVKRFDWEKCAREIARLIVS
jgi:glycosyltransferase involved in cell wall biosynthesis